MPEVINVRFRGRGKAYTFDPGGFSLADGSAVVVETSKGLELGECVGGVYEAAEESVVQPLRSVVRVATEEDIRTAEANRRREKAAFDICEERIRAHGLDMKLVDVEYSFEGGKILFFFTSDGRVDFRELVKDLAGQFHTRIELRQIGVRDGAKMIGGLGICGRPFCCSTFLQDFQPVSIRMAKTQNLSLNPTKISGTCGRLMCCLKYEQEAYEYLTKTLPRAEASVDTPKGKGTVTEVNLLRRTVKVRLADQTDNSQTVYPVDRLGYTINGEYIEPKPEEAPVAEPAMPDLSFYMADEPGRLGSRGASGEPRRGDRGEGDHRGGRNRHRGGRGGGKKSGGEAKGEAAPRAPEQEFRRPERAEDGRRPGEGKPRPPKNHGPKQPPKGVPVPPKAAPAPEKPKQAASAEKAPGEGRKPYHRRGFHGGGKKPGGGKSEP